MAPAPRLADAAAANVPLSERGRLVLPLAVREGMTERLQQVIRIRRREDRLEEDRFEYCRFVPILPGVLKETE